MANFISIQDQTSGEFVHEEVSDNVYAYIRQLEVYIKHPQSSRLLEVYPHLTKRAVDRLWRGLAQPFSKIKLWFAELFR